MDGRAVRSGVADAYMSHETPRAISARRHAKAPLERPREYLVAPKTAGQRDSEHRLAPREQQRSSLTEAKAKPELLWRFSGGSRK